MVVLGIRARGSLTIFCRWRNVEVVVADESNVENVRSSLTL